MYTVYMMLLLVSIPLMNDTDAFELESIPAYVAEGLCVHIT